MIYITKKIVFFLLVASILIPTIVLGAYDVNLRGGVEIKEAAEIISRIFSLYTIKMVALIALGFTFALQGIYMLTNSISQALNKEQPPKSLLLGLMGIILVFGGLVVIFKDEVIVHLKTKGKHNKVTLEQTVESKNKADS